MELVMKELKILYHLKENLVIINNFNLEPCCNFYEGKYMDEKK